MRMPAIRIVFAFFVVLGLGVFAHVSAHPNGVSKITLNLRDGDTLIVTSDVNRDDVLNAIRETPFRDSLTPEYSRRFMEKVAYYLQSRLRLEVDGRGLSNMQVISWDSLGKSDPSLIDSADLSRLTFIITYQTQIPAQGQRLAISPQYFLEFGIQPLSEVSVFWHKQLVQRSWLTPDKTLRLPLSRDSLAARLARNADTTSAQKANIEGGFWRFVVLGFDHIVPYGFDHILFVLGLFFFSTKLGPLLWQITAFTVAHSLTLALSLLGVIQLSPRVVEPLIALSIAVVGIENIFFRKFRPSRWLIVFAFGLVHGLGFAGILTKLGIPKDEFWATLIGFNLGVEFGQLTVVGVAAALMVWFWRQAWYFKAIVVPVSASIGAVGLYWAIQRVFFP